MLELAEACGIPTRWSCRTGVCHTCESGLLSGAVGYSPVSTLPPTAVRAPLAAEATAAAPTPETSSGANAPADNNRQQRGRRPWTCRGSCRLRQPRHLGTYPSAHQL
ncbi:2Fe-2S iron-sulfur cluster-binding protein [Streptosporangium sp. G11]|uniref:2Fe-2S iron-sulfur cluster-binding protein n=1 Tax=Streptosporangium sp. G11 TaxID=3436926 RepID=UPI003EC0268E